MRLLKFAATLGILAAVMAAAASAGTLKVENTTFGWDPFTETITVGGSTPQSQYPAIAVNQPIEITFDQNLSKSSITSSRVFVTSVGAAVLGPVGLSSTIPGGQIAPVSLVVKGDTISISPAIFFSGSAISFGFAPGAYYRLELKGKGKGIKGSGGDKLAASVYIDFRTGNSVTDPSPGAPKATVKVKDSKKGQVTLKITKEANPVASFTQATPSPSPSILLKFNELVLPSTLLNPATGISPNVEIELDSDGDGKTTNDRIMLPGNFKISHSTKKTKLVWKPSLQSIPPKKLFVVTIRPLVEDLVGNSKYTETSDIGANDVYAYRTKDGKLIDQPPIVETFNTVLNRDDDATSADWADTTIGKLLNGFGGGSGADGDFNPTSNEFIETFVFDTSIGKNVQKVWNFTSVDIPAGVAVAALGDFPLIIRCTGPVNIKGTLNVSGQAGAQFAESQVSPGAGGGTSIGGSGLLLDDATGVGGADGGLGGSVTNGQDLDDDLFLPGISYYAPAVSPNQGLSGLSSAISDWTLTRGEGIPFASNHVGLWLQPNTGTGTHKDFGSPGEQINHNHPTFQLASLGVPNEATIINDTMDPDYFGALTQPSLDLYELPPPPIAKPLDPYMIGDLKGHDGHSIGYPDGEGKGSLPLTVAQGFITQVRSGGGGGGGARTDGLAGEDSPPAGLWGENTGTEGGTGGTGYLTATVTGQTATVVTVQGTPFAGLDLSFATGTHSIVFPDITSGYVFAIESNTDNTITIKELALPLPTAADTDANGILNLADMSVGMTCRVEPAFSVGGNGGGGTGVHLAGTTKLTGPAPAVPLTLPEWTPGAGGGAGGGSVWIESAKRISVLVGGQILARGGSGGRSTGSIGTSASGGGGGGGGVVRLGTADTSTFGIRVDGLVDASGGQGGAGFVEGGEGGAGRVRMESMSGALLPSSYPVTKVKPEVQDTDLGFMIPGLSPSVGQSDFFFTQTLVATYTSYELIYDAVVDGDPKTGLVYTSNDFAMGKEAPFSITFNDAEMSGTGDLDMSSIDDVFSADLSTLAGPFIRFRIVLTASAVANGKTYTSVAVDKLTINFSG